MTKLLTLSWKNCQHWLSASLDDSPDDVEDWFIQQLYKHQHEDYFCWLDSAADTHPNSRYHIALRQPLWVLTANQQNCQLQQLNPQLPEPNAAALEQLPLLDAAAELLEFAQQVIAVPNSDLPFNGGFAGVLGYDLGRQIERLPNTNAEEYNMADAVLGFYTQALLLDKHTNQVWVLADSNNHQQVLNDWLAVSASGPETDFALTGEWQSNMTRQQYGDKFNAVKHYLREGDSYQVNLAQRFVAAYQGSEWQAYQGLRQHNLAPFSAFMRAQGSTILSVSPERFLAVDDHGHVETKPIKGTRPRYSDPEEDQRSQQALLTAEKDRAENLMIVDLLRNDLSRSCQPGTVDVPSLFALESFPAVHHLVSTVVGQLKPGLSALDLIKGAFPGGSITGAPKVRSMEIIEELEPNRRSVYCGSVAYFSLCGRSDSSITIRTLLAERQHVFCWAGGGLVFDSQEAEEYQETFDKVARILPILENL